MAESKTIVIINEEGKLIDVTGAIRESQGSNYDKFVKRLISPSNDNISSLDFGWDGATTLHIVNKTNSDVDTTILLDADSVVVTGDFSVNGKTLDEIILDNSLEILDKIKGTPDQVDINKNETEYTIKLSDKFLERVNDLEQIIEKLFQFGDVFTAGDGLVLNREKGNKLEISVGTGLKIERHYQPVEDDTIQESESGSGSGSESESIELIELTPTLAVDTLDELDFNSSLPITSKAIANAIDGITAATTHVKITSAGNYYLVVPMTSLENQPDDPEHIEGLEPKSETRSTLLESIFPAELE